LDQALSERETINSRMQDHMADATAKWGVRLNRIEILDITPPINVVQAMSEQKEAEQHKRALILKSEGEQTAAVNSAGGRKQAAVLEAEGAKQSAILRAEAEMKVLELQAEGEKKALELRGEGEASRLTSIDTATINPRTLAVLQLKALQDIAASDNAKVVVPYEATSLMGAAEVLLSTLRNEDLGAATTNGATPPVATPARPPSGELPPQ
jgi:regulator of protease activity HflC (stomatin/prohibitin superfamily)